MKCLHWLFSIILIFAVSTGCAKKKGGIDVAPLQKSFESAETPIKTDIQNAVIALEKGHHSEALAYLNKIASKAKLTAEQQAVVKSTTDQILALMKQKTDEAAQRLQKSLQKK